MRLTTMDSLTVGYLGHSCFECVTEEGVRVLIDPHITGNGAASLTLEEVEPPDLILVTHAAPDHLGDTLTIAKRSGCHVFCDPAALQRRLGKKHLESG